MTSKELKQIMLDSAGDIDESDIDWIICYTSGISRSTIASGLKLRTDIVEESLNLLQQRKSGKPLDYILGKTNFYGREFNVCESCLIPRPETEELVELVLKEVIVGEGLDIGTGSGAIAITLMLENRNIKMKAVDISLDALAIAKDNAKKHNVLVEFVHSDLFSKLNEDDKFDFIVSNPPYIKSEDVDHLSREVKDFEPKLALDGGVDGLDFYREIIKQAPHYLKKDGKIFFEVGIDEAEDIKRLLDKDFKDIKIVKDLEQIDRMVMAKLK